MTKKNLNINIDIIIVRDPPARKPRKRLNPTNNNNNNMKNSTNFNSKTRQPINNNGSYRDYINNDKPPDDVNNSSMKDRIVELNEKNESESYEAAKAREAAVRFYEPRRDRNGIPKRRPSKVLTKEQLMKLKQWDNLDVRAGEGFRTYYDEVYIHISLLFFFPHQLKDSVRIRF